MLGQILLVFAFVFAVIAASNRVPTNLVHWGWLAVAFWILSILLGGFGIK